MADPTWSKLAWTVRKSTRIKTLYEDIAEWDKKSRVDLSAANGAVVLLAINTIAEEVSKVPEEDIATVRKAVSNILQCLLDNTDRRNRAIFFKVLEAVELGQPFLASTDRKLCQQLVEEAYGSKKPEVKSTEKALPEGREGGDIEVATPKGNEEEDIQETSAEGHEEEEEDVEGETPKEEEPQEGGMEETATQEIMREGDEEEGVETGSGRKEGEDLEETVREDASPKPQKVAGAKKLLAKMSSGLSKDASAVPPAMQEAALLLDSPFWGEPLTAATAVSVCIDMAGFDTVRGGTVEELSTSLLASPGSGEKGTNLSEMYRKLTQLCLSVECALVLFDLPSVWNASSRASMEQLKGLIVLCSNAAISSAYTANYLSRLRSSQSTGSADLTPGGAAPLTAATGEKQLPKTFAELLAALSSTALRQPTGVSVQASVSVAAVIIKTALKACDSTREPSSPQQDPFPSQVLRNIRFLVIHCLFQGLYPAVCRQGQLNEAPKHVRYSSNMSEMLQCGVQLLSSLLDDVSKEAIEAEPRILVWQEFSLIGHYSCLAQLSCLNRSVPVVDMLLGVAESSCKRAVLQPQVMMFTPTLPAAEGTSTAGPSEVAPALPPLPVKRSKLPASRSMNVVIQQILQSAVADVNSQLSGEQGGGEGEAGELEEEEDNAREDRDGSGSAYSSRSSEEGEEVYVLFNEDDSAHEDASALYGFVDSPLYVPAMLPTDQVNPSPIPEAPPLPPKRKNQNQRPLPPLPTGGDDVKALKSGDSQDPIQRRVPFLKLALCAVECLQGKLLISSHVALQAFLRSNFSVESVQCLGRLVQCIDSNKNKTVGKMAEFVSVRESVVGVTNELILMGTLEQSRLEEAFLVELGMKDVGGEWPLSVPLCTLSVLARLLVRRLCNLETGNDLLCVDVWQRLLFTLESNACQSSFLSSKQDLSVVHCQLLMFIFHHFTKETRTSLFKACITSVIRAAQARRSGANTSSLALARLLTVMDYLMFQFSGESTQHFEQLTEQVYQNLLSSASLLLSDEAAKYYPGTIEGDYTRVLLKILQQNSSQATDTMRPRFFNLRPVKMRTLGEEPPEEEDSTFAEVCHSVILSYRGPDGQDYTDFHQSIVFLFGSVLQSSGGHFEGSPFQKVLYATAARQCVDLCQNLLMALPPSSTFLQRFFTNEGFSMDTSDGAASFLVLLRFLSMLRSQALDSGDLLEALEQSGSSSEEAEELVGRVMSLTSTNDFFVPLALQHLKKALDLPDDRLPCEITLIVIDLLVTMVGHEVTPFMATPKEVVPKRRKARRRKKGGEGKQESSGAKEAKDSAKQEEGVEGTDSVETKGKRPIKRKPTPADSGIERVPEFVSEAVPIISQLLSKMMKYADLYVIHGESTLEDKPRPDDPLHEDLEQMEEVYALMLRVGQTPKGWQELFRDELPVALQERLAIWIEALEVSKEDEGDNKFIEPGSLLSRILIKHLIAFAGYRPFSCVRSMKSVVVSTTRVMHDLCTICDEVTDDVVTRLIPAACGKTAEKLHIIDPSVDTAAESSPNMVHIESVKLMLSTAHQLVHHPTLQHSRLLGGVVENAIKLVSSLVDDPSLWPALVILPTAPYPTDITSLILATASDNVQPGAVSEGLRLLLKIIQLPDKSAHPSTLLLYEQLASLTAQREELVHAWLQSVVVDRDDKGTVNTDNLTLFSAITMGLTQEESGIDSGTLRCILHHLISLGPQVLELVGKNRSFLMFKLFWSTCVALASSDILNDHITLLKAAAQWLSTSVEMMPSGPEEGDSTNSPSLVILEYLMLMSSALYLTLDQEQYASHHSLVSDKVLTLSDAEQDLEESLTAEEEENSDDEGLNTKLCSFTVTQKTFIHQYWYHCYTCGLAENTGVCSICAKVCHRDHELAYSKYGAFFCDCGARGEAHCKALTPRASDPTAKKKKARPAVMAKRPEAKEVSADKVLPHEEKSKEPVIPSAVVKLSQQIEGSKNVLKEFFESSNLAAQALDLLSRLKPAVVKESRELMTCSGLALAQQALRALHYKEKRVEHVETLMAAILGSPEGAFDNVKLNFSGDQGQVMKQLLSSFAIHRVAMCCVSGGQGKKQHLAVSHDKGKFAILQLSALLKQTDSNKRKLTLTRLTTMNLPFTILSLAVNPSYDSYLAMCGLKECAVMCFNSSGQAVERLTLHPSVDYNGYIVKCIWMPGSRSELAVVSDTFVKIYDLALDAICPQYCFIVMSGKVKDATFVVNKQGKHLVVMMSGGMMYSQPVVPECSAVDGPVYLVRELVVGHDQVEVGADGVVCGGGASVYFSHSLQLLLFSYMNGKTFASHLSTDATHLEKLFYIPLKSSLSAPPANSGADNVEGGPSSGTGSGPGKPTTSASLVQWTEVPNFPGMICTLSQATSTPVVMFFRPEVIQVHELKALSSKSKVQGMVAMHQVQGNGDAEAAKTTLVLLSEDGSLRIYLASNTSETKYWVQPQFQASSPLAALQPRGRRMAKEGPKGDHVKFPIDFFEHCVPLTSGDVEFGGTDLLHVYNTTQVKTRLTTNGMYICNTRPSGFVVEVTNNQWKSSVLAGVRVLLGNKPPDRIPSYIEVFGRRRQCNMAGNTPRWFDFPFTREESLQADKSLKIKFGPSIDPSGISFVDSIRLYSKAKSVIGWPEGPSEVPATQTNGSVTQQAGEMGPLEESAEASALPTMVQSLSRLDRMTCNSLSLLANCCSCIEVPQQLKSACFETSRDLLTISLPPTVQYHCRYLMSSVVKGREEFHSHADTALLSYVVRALYTSPTDPELFQRLLLSLLTVSRSHPQNLVPLLDKDRLKEFCAAKRTLPPENADGEGEGESEKKGESPSPDMEQDFLTKLNAVFWELIEQTPVTPAVTSVATPVLLGVDLVVKTMVEVMWAFVASGQVSVQVMVPHLVKMLQAQEAKISSTCMRTLIFLVKPLPKKTPPVPTTAQEPVDGGKEEEKEAGQAAPEEERGAEVDGEQPATEREGEEDVPGEPGEQGGNQDLWDSLLPALPQQWHQALNLLRIEFPTPTEAMEHILANPQQFMAAMEGVIPGFDDDALMNIALVLSSQEQPSQAPFPEELAPVDVDVAVADAVANAVLDSYGSSDSLTGPVPHELAIPDDQVVQPEEEEEEEGEEDDDIQQEEEQQEQQGSSSSSPSTLTPPGAGDGGARKTLQQREEQKKGSGEDEGSSGGDSSADEEQEAEDDVDLDHTLTDTQSTSTDDQAPIDASETAESLQGTDTADAARRGSLSLLRELVDMLPTLTDKGGVGIIPIMQVVLVLCTHLDLRGRERKVLAEVLQNCFKAVNFASQDVQCLTERTSQHEVQLILLRFISILLSYRKKDKRKDAKQQEVVNTRLLSIYTAKLLLKDTSCMEFCLNLLQALLRNQDSLQPADDPASSSTTMKVPPSSLSSDLMPFFQRDYVKANSDDVMRAFPRMLTDMALTLPTELKKISENSRKLKKPVFGPMWTDTLCEFLNSAGHLATMAKKPLKKLLVSICGSKEECRRVRDLHYFGKQVECIKSLCFSHTFPLTVAAGPLLLPHATLLQLISHVKEVCDRVTLRPANWQAFCSGNEETLALLLKCALFLNEGVSPFLLKLLYIGVSGRPLTANEKGVPKSEVKPGEYPEVSFQLTTKLMTFLSKQDLLRRFVVLFLLQSNSTETRWQAHALLYSIFHTSQPEHKMCLMEMLWKLWPEMAAYGHRAAQFVDILGYVTVSSRDLLPQRPELKQAVCQQAIGQLSRLNELLAWHPSAHIYTQLATLVNFDGYYLESEPCSVCNNPELPNSNMKLMAVKSEVRYSPNAMFVKLKGSFSISQFTISISDIKKSKMVRVVKLYYSNRTVQNAIELKNKRSIWLKAQSETLSSGQSEVKFEFPLPITACNIVLEFAEFYTNMQASPEVLHCPRCGASVPAHPGVCGQCGENVFQCHKCRSINYDEKDPFLCNSCGISKYAKFDYTMVGKECTSVDPIETDEDRAKTLSNISALLERANSVYERLVDHRHTLDRLLSQVSSSSNSPPTSSTPVYAAIPTVSRGGSGQYLMVSEGHPASSGTEGMVNRSIQEVAVCYSRNCKATYRELSNLICSVMASRQEVTEYDQKKVEASRQEGIPISPMPTPNLNWAEEQCSERSQQKTCYGCASAAVGHCVTLLKALALSSETRSLLVEARLIGQLVHNNQRGNSSATRHNVQDLLCLLTKNNLEATQELSHCILSRVMSVVNNHHLSPNVATAVQPEVNLLLATLAIKDQCWEHRLRTVVTLFQNTRRHSNPVVVEVVALRCLAVLRDLTGHRPLPLLPQKEGEEATAAVETSGEKPEEPPSPASHSLPRPVPVNVGAWLREEPSMTFSSWVERAKEEKRRMASQTPEEQRAEVLQAKYSRLWRSRIHKFSTARTQQHHKSWLRSMLFNPSSRAARLAACTMVRSLLQQQQGSNSRRVWTMLDMLCSYLPDVSVAGEKAAEFLGLFGMLTTDDSSKIYLASKGILQTIGKLLADEIKALSRLERSTLTADVAQGFSLLMLAQLLKSFLDIETIKETHKGHLVGVVLHSYLGLRCLVVQRTKYIEDAQGVLLKILEDLTSGTEEEKKKFMAECVAILDNFSSSDLLTPVFVFERLCNMILPEKSKEAVFFLQLDKDPQQEEFLQGKMQGNPYRCTDPGLGPLMRDIKNKICTDCELVALLDDDSGMELLVCNKIISLDLPVADVYKKVWLTQATPSSHVNHCMRVVYRMRGLMGDATEDIIETLDSGSSESVDEEQLYHMADTMSQCGGLEAALTRLSHVQDVSRGHQLLTVVLKFLSSCLKLKVNRQYAIQPHLNTLNTLLAVLNRALRFEQDHSDGVGASIAEKVLSVMGSVLLEASNSQTVIIRQSSMGGESTAPELASDEQSQLGQLLKHIETPFVQSNPSIRKALMRVLPYLTFGNVGSMNALLDYFKPFLNFDRYDAESSTEGTLHLDCFIAVASGIGSDVGGAKLKDLMVDQGLVQLCVDYIHTRVPPAASYADFESHQWRECLASPSLPYVLQILTGLCQNHHTTQRLLVDVTPQLHVLEQVSSAEHIGSMTEALLKVLDEDGVVAKVEEARRATRQEKAERAMAVREKMLHEFGMKVNEKGQVIAQSQVMKDLEKTVKIEEEKGLTCCICREGYENEPKKLLGVYTFTKRCSVDEFERKPRKTQGFCTVTHFNVIHYDCHTSAVMTARGRNEWESAMLQNSNTRCNGILPIWGPEVSESAFASCLARHNSYVREATNHYDASYSAWIHDLKSLLLRFAHERSFSSESGGGGPQSNVHVVPYLLHVALYVLNTTRLYASEERALTAFVTSPEDAWVSTAYELDGAHYMLASSLVVFNFAQWKDNRVAFLKRLLVTAHARHISPAHITGLPAESSPLEYSVYKPCLVLFGLVDHFQGRLKKKLEVSGEGLPEALLDYIRQNTSGLSSVCDKVLSLYQEELLTAESFEEMLDVLDLLGEVPDPSQFLSSLLASVTV